MKKILLIEDDANLAFMVTDGLEGSGFEVLHLTKGEVVIETLKKFQPDITLLDVNLKGAMNGFEVSKAIRQISQVPIIFTTSRTQIKDMQEGYKVGNVDYLKKPFGVRELILRINELLSRVNPKPTIPAIHIGRLIFSASEHWIQIAEDKIHLQKNECVVLNLLLENIGKVLSRNEILAAVWEDDEDLKSKEASLHNILSGLRTKLSADGKVSIVTIPKIGYKLTMCNEHG